MEILSHADLSCISAAENVTYVTYVSWQSMYYSAMHNLARF